MADAPPIDETEEPKDKKAIADRWRIELSSAKKKFETAHKRGTEIVRQYRDEAKAGTTAGADRKTIEGMNIFWSSNQTIRPALYSRLPTLNFDRRFPLVDDPIATEAAEILQSATQFIMSENGLHQALKDARDDYLLPGIGTIWHRYEPTYDQAETSAGITYDRVAYETVKSEHVLWKDFLFDPAPCWERTRWVAKRVNMSKKEVRKRFGAEAAEQLSYGVVDELEKDLRDTAEPTREVFQRASIWEIWDKEDREVYWLAEGYADILEVKEDPLHLVDFFPCARPLLATTTTDNQIPVADYVYIQDQQAMIDLLVTRKHLLTEMLRLSGVRDAAFTELDQLVNETDENQLIAVQHYAAFQEAGGFEGVMQFMPLRDVATALAALEPLMQQEKQQVYEITGHSDLMRGATNPHETARAQDLKNTYTNLRLGDRQGEMQRFARDNIQIEAEIIAEHFAPETLQMITGKQIRPEVIKVLQSDVLRTVKIDIETDSMVHINQQAERQDRIEALQIIGSFIERVIPMVQQVPELAPFAAQALMLVVKSFKSARGLEEALKKGLEQVLNRGPQKEAPDPALIKVQAQSQADQMRLQQEAQQFQAEMQLKFQQQQAQTQLKLKEMADNFQLQLAKIAGQIQGKRYQTDAKAQTEIAVGQLQAQATAGAQQEAAETGKTPPVSVNILPGMF